MPEPTPQPNIQSINWKQSDAMKAAIGGVVAALVGAIVAILSLFGVTLDPEFQGKLIAAMMAIYTFVSLGFHVWGIFARLNTTTVIAGSKGEQKVVDAGGTVVPKAPPSPSA
jgi:hypothetical protein